MTAMLAFFIVLNTMAQEQTGANLHSGTGSFVSAISSMGLPGMFSGDGSKLVQQMNDVAPKYAVNDGEPIPGASGNGPDEDDNGIRVLNREADNLQRVLVEFEQHFEVKSSSVESTAVAFDLFQKPDKGNNFLPTDLRRVFAKTIGLMTRPGYRMELNVWSPTPSVTALARTAELAFQIRKAIRKEFPVFERREDSIRATANLWPHSDDRRPVMSVVIIKETVSSQ